MSDTSPASVDDALEQAKASLRELRRAPPGETPQQSRERANERIKLQKFLTEAAKRVVAKSTQPPRPAPARTSTNGSKEPTPVNEMTKEERRELRSKSATMLDLTRLADHVGIALRDIIWPLEKRIKELEARPSVEYRGVFDKGTEYLPGSAVTHQGSLWIAKIITKGVAPDDAPAFWQLAVKRGRDGKGTR